MKLKQALLLGLSTAVLAIPAFAAEDAMNAANSSSSVSTNKQGAVSAKKDAARRQGHKSDASKGSADQLSTDADSPPTSPSEQPAATN